MKIELKPREFFAHQWRGIISKNKFLKKWVVPNGRHIISNKTGEHILAVYWPDKKSGRYIRVKIGDFIVEDEEAEGGLRVLQKAEFQKHYKRIFQGTTIYSLISGMESRLKFEPVEEDDALMAWEEYKKYGDDGDCSYYYAKKDKVSNMSVYGNKKPKWATHIVCHSK